MEKVGAGNGELRCRLWGNGVRERSTLGPQNTIWKKFEGRIELLGLDRISIHKKQNNSWKLSVFFLILIFFPPEMLYYISKRSVQILIFKSYNNCLCNLRKVSQFIIFMIMCQRYHIQAHTSTRSHTHTLTYTHFHLLCVNDMLIISQTWHIFLSSVKWESQLWSMKWTQQIYFISFSIYSIETIKISKIRTSYKIWYIRNSVLFFSS